jgi:peptidoglycan-associated lipoprotein
MFASPCGGLTGADPTHQPTCHVLFNPEGLFVKSTACHAPRNTLLIALFSSALLWGCSSTPLNTDVPVESRTGTPASGSTGNATASQSKVAPVDLTNSNSAKTSAAAQGLARVFYFDFDSYVLKDEYRSAVEGHAKSLSADRKKRLALQGHTDERGGREYNLALGQKRAEAVMKSLVLLGATDTQVEAVSFGEERPAVQGNNEAAWTQNRRVELSTK